MEKLCAVLSALPLQESHKCMLENARDLETLRDLSNRITSMKEGNSTLEYTVDTKGLVSNKKTCIEDKENFLMPAPKERPLRLRKRKTRDIDEEIKVRQSSRVTRSSRMTGVLNGDMCMTGKPATKPSRATKSTLPTSSPEMVNNEMSLNGDSDFSFSAESKKGRRTTKKAKELAPRASQRGTRASSRASTRTSTRASTRATTRATTRGSSLAKIDTSYKCNSSAYVVKESVPPQEHTRETTRTTRAGAGKGSFHVDSAESVVHLKSSVPAESPLSKKKLKSNLLFSPYGKSTVKARVEAFEGLSSQITEPVESRSKGKETVQKGVLTDEGHHDDVVPSVVVGAVSPEERVLVRVDSPLVKGKVKHSYKKVSTVIIKEDPDVSAMEVEEMDVMVEELLKTSNSVEELSSVKKSGAIKNDHTFHLSPSEEKIDDENEADDEWMTDDEDKIPGSKKGGISDHAPTPKQNAPSSKLSAEVPSSYKALRSRKVNKASSEVSLTLSSKAKTTPVLLKNASNVFVQPQKVVESEVKEAELKRQQEKEMEAIKRKEELLKKRTETTKKKREEKMSKVKRTREEKEKELEAKKVKKAKNPAKKKKNKEVKPEVEEKKTPVKQVAAPVQENQLNSTYTMPEEEECGGYNMTPHWEDLSPKQPENPNDYGVVDKSDCSSEEENDPRKKIPLWTKQIHSELLYQSFISTEKIFEFWQTKPRALNIEVLFGNKVSKNTRKRGLHYRTSSAIWHTPPMKTQALE